MGTAHAGGQVQRIRQRQQRAAGCLGGGHGGGSGGSGGQGGQGDGGRGQGAGHGDCQPHGMANLRDGYGTLRKAVTFRTGKPSGKARIYKTWTCSTFDTGRLLRITFEAGKAH